MEKIIQYLINKVEENKYGSTNYKNHEITLSEDTWTSWYHISVKDITIDKYIYESNIYVKNTTLLNKCLKMIMEYIDNV